MSRIAILGGTFNPIHNGHLQMAAAVMKTNQFDQILFMPSGDPPHKKGEQIIDKKHRLAMCEAAVLPYSQYAISNLELNRTGYTYTLDTINVLEQTHPENRYTMIIGADSLMQLDQWHHYDELLRLCPFIVINRPGYPSSQLLKQIQLFEEKHHAQIEIIEMPDSSISSSEIRKRDAQHLSITHLVPKGVADYMVLFQLYQENSVEGLISDYQEKVGKSLSKKRFAHSISVMNTAAKLAEIYDVNINKAKIAGLLHDCGKSLTDEQKLKMCEENGLSISNVERNLPDLLHAKLGALIAKKDYQIDDQEILDAIASHTTGKPNMTILDKIIFIADYIEPLRNQASNLEECRHLVQKSLDETLVKILHDTLAYLNEKSAQIDLMTQTTYEYYEKRK